MCVYIYIYIYIYIQICVYIYIHTYIYILQSSLYLDSAFYLRDSFSNSLSPHYLKGHRQFSMRLEHGYGGEKGDAHLKDMLGTLLYVYNE